MPEPTCDSCRLWRRLEDSLGECHAVAPAPLVTAAPGLYHPLAVVWPRTGAVDGCGGWRPLPVRPQEGGQTT